MPSRTGGLHSRDPGVVAMSSSMRASPTGGAAGVPEALSETLVELSLGQSAAGAQLNVDVAGSLLRHAVLKGAFSYWVRGPHCSENSYFVPAE